MNTRADLEAVLEAVLFVAGEPVTRQRLIELFDESDRGEAEQALDSVLHRFATAEGRGITIDQAGGGIRLVTRPDLNPYLRRFFEISGAHKLSMAALETLAIVAYRQPITGPEIQELRSVSSAGVLKTLLERRLIRIAGRKAVVGKPFLYATTREFLMHFGLQSLKDLPPLEDFEELAPAALASSERLRAAVEVHESAGNDTSPLVVGEETRSLGEGDLPLLAGDDPEETFAREVAALEEEQL